VRGAATPYPPPHRPPASAAAAQKRFIPRVLESEPPAGRATASLLRRAPASRERGSLGRAVRRNASGRRDGYPRRDPVRPRRLGRAAPGRTPETTLGFAAGCAVTTNRGRTRHEVSDTGSRRLG